MLLKLLSAKYDPFFRTQCVKYNVTMHFEFDNVVGFEIDDDNETHDIKWSDVSNMYHCGTFYHMILKVYFEM